MTLHRSVTASAESSAAPTRKSVCLDFGVDLWESNDGDVENAQSDWNVNPIEQCTHRANFTTL